MDCIHPLYRIGQAEGQKYPLFDCWLPRRYGVCAGCYNCGMLSEYIRAAMARAEVLPLEGTNEFFGEIPGLQGVWSSEPTPEACRAELRDVLESWLLLRLTRGMPIPVLDGVDLSVSTVS